MNDLTRAITIAGFFHDLGKFAERAGAIVTGDKDEVKQQYRFAHAHHTELALLQLFDETRLTRRFGAEPEFSILNMASRHHKPRNFAEIIVSEADRIASGHERTEADDISAGFESHGRERKSKVPMVSILSRIRLTQFISDEIEDWRYKITTPANVISQTGVDEVFPIHAAEYTDEEVQQDYKAHWQAFKDAIRPSNDNGLDPFDNFRTIFELSRVYQWCLPATTRKEDMTDVSLFDHLKTTAALAACLYEYHKDSEDDLSESEIRDRRKEKYLLFCGDISGIQKFIYQISSKRAYNLLKGRSFYIQILAEILAQDIVTRCGLLFTNILYASGGKFYLLLPNTEKIRKQLNELTHKINKELFELFNGDIYVRTGWKALSGYDLTRESGKNLYEIWEELTREVIYNDRKRYAKLASQNYQRIFDTEEYLPETCSVCHRSFKGNSKGKCRTCQEMERIGKLLGTAKYIAIDKAENALNNKSTFKFLGNYVWMLDDEPEIGSPEELTIYSLGDPEIQGIPLKHSSKKVNGAVLLAGATHKFDETFDVIAQKSNGIKRLGILRMDVDNLGKIFCEGLLNYKHNKVKKDSRFYSIGRITTLSWQLSLFFSGIVPALIRLNPDWDNRVTVVYSGGDDLFLLGAWDAIPHVAFAIREKLREFACENRSFGLSGGMVITRGHFPIYKSAEMAGEAESAAKKKITLFKSEKIKKDSFVFLDMPMHWKEFSVLATQYHNLLSIIEDKKNYPLLHRLRQIHAACITCSGEKETMTLQEIEDRILAERWQWLMVYALSRFDKNKPALKDQIENLQRFISGHVAETNRLGIELLGVLSRWCELRVRKN